MADQPDAFNELAGDLDYPMFIVTAARAGERAGCLVGFATQVSIDPARFLVCISKKNRTLGLAREARLLAVHLVPQEQRHLAELFGGATGDDIDKFARCAWSTGPAGTPLLDACRSRFVGRVVSRVDMGDHVGFLLEPVAADHVRDERPLTFQSAKEIDPGHEA
jgi:flavin reductase (DIM6/NTAB) family NADH-FMN oxidoreductase RutF